MKFLNLTLGFNPYKAKSQHLIKFDSFTFSGGEPHIRINDNNYIDVTITHRINSFEDLGLLMVAVDAIKRNSTRAKRSNYSINLFLPYFPGARQDRVMVPGEALTVKIYADIINSLGLDNVFIYDPHSDVAPALLNNCKVINNHVFVAKVLDELFPDNEDFYIVSPDAGSNKKMKDLLKATQHPNLLKCDKERDVKTGRIRGFEVYAEDLKGKDYVIIDDICDGGGTFIGLAEELKLKGAGDLYLIVSHGIFSKGFNELNKHFKDIYTTDSIETLARGPYTQIKLSEVL